MIAVISSSLFPRGCVCVCNARKMNALDLLALIFFAYLDLPPAVPRQADLEPIGTWPPAHTLPGLRRSPSAFHRAPDRRSPRGRTVGTAGSPSRAPHEQCARPGWSRAKRPRRPARTDGQSTCTKGRKKKIKQRRRKKESKGKKQTNVKERNTRRRNGRKHKQ